MWRLRQMGLRFPLNTLTVSQSHSILSCPVIFQWRKIKFHSQTLRPGWYQWCHLTFKNILYLVDKIVSQLTIVGCLCTIQPDCHPSSMCLRPCPSVEAHCCNLKMCPALQHSGTTTGRRRISLQKKNILLVTRTCQRAPQKLEIAACYEML